MADYENNISANSESSYDDEELYKEFTAEQDLKPEEKFKLVEKLDKMFRYALDNPTWVAARNKMIECFKYKEGEQWTAKELQELKDRGQPDTVNNQIAPAIDKLMGDLVNQRFRVAYRGRNDEQDKLDAEVASDILLHVRQANRLEFEERDMAEDGFTCGFGDLNVSVEFDDMLTPEIKVRHDDSLITFPDPDSKRYDWNEDARFIAKAKWVDLEDSCARYPQAEKDLKGAVAGTFTWGGDHGGQMGSVDSFKGEIYVSKDKQRIREIQIEYKKTKRENLLLMGDGTSFPFEDIKEVKSELRRIKAEGLNYKIIPRLSHTMCVGTYAAGVLLEHIETEYKLFSDVPYFAGRRKNGAPYSKVTLALSMQDAVNKRESKAIHLLTTNQTTYETNAISDPVKFAEEKVKPDGMKEVATGALANQRIVEQQNLELASTQFTMHQAAIEQTWRIMGIDPRMGQQTGEIRSGSGLQRKYAEASKPIAKMFDNIRRTREIFSRVVLERVSKNYTPRKIVLITDDPKKAGVVDITADQLERIKTRNYDVVVEELEDTTDVQSAEFQTLATTLPNILQFGPYWSQKLIKLSRLRDKDEVVEELKSQPPPPLEAKVSFQANIDALTFIERAAAWKRLGEPEVAQQLLQMQPAPLVEVKGELDIKKEVVSKSIPEKADETGLKIEQQKSVTEQAKQGTERVKQDTARIKGGADEQRGKFDIAKELIKANAPKAPKAQKESAE